MCPLAESSGAGCVDVGSRDPSPGLVTHRTHTRVPPSSPSASGGAAAGAEADGSEGPSAGGASAAAPSGAGAEELVSIWKTGAIGAMIVERR